MNDTATVSGQLPKTDSPTSRHFSTLGTTLKCTCMYPFQMHSWTLLGTEGNLLRNVGEWREVRETNGVTGREINIFFW